LKRLAVLATVLVVLIVLVVAQLVLPGIAAERLRDRLSSSGTVTSVKISAFPAIELLWHHADRVVVRMADYRAAVSALGSTLAGAVDAGSVDASATQLDVGLLTLRDASLTKRGDQLTGSARVTQSDLRAAVPFIDDVRPLASGGGQLTLQGTATLFGVSATVAATVAAQGGSVIVQPDVPLGGLATVTVFSNPHLAVEDIAASAAPGGFSLRARGQLH
jgi:LmeA-like phospholipid-binding